MALLSLLLVQEDANTAARSGYGDGAGASAGKKKKSNSKKSKKA
jgi:hypothetical protein